MMRRGREITARDHLVGLALGTAYVAILLATAPSLGLSRDEGMYVVAADRYGAWFEALAQDRERALDPSVIDAHWATNHEHPPLVKSLFAISAVLDRRHHLFPLPSLAYRFPAMVVSGALVWLVYLFGARSFGRLAGVFAAIAIAAMPRVFYHAHLACFDVPITFFATLVTYYYWRSLAKPSLAIAAGLTYGLALATKHNAWMLPGIFTIHFVWMAVRELRERKRTGRARVSLVPWWLFAMAILGPAIFVGSWPWLWHDTANRFREYAAFHLHHEYYNMAYVGVNYFRPPFPVSYPFVMTFFTVPLTVIVLALLAIAARIYAIVPWPLAKLVPEDLRVRRDSRASDVLFFGCLAAPIVVIALPSTPIFGGTKHWFPAYPFLALYAGYGAQRTARVVRSVWAEHFADRRNLVRALTAGILLAPSIVETAHAHPFGLSSYTYAAGGAPGAADLGMNRQFWGFTTGSLAPFLRAHLPDGGSVWLCDTLPESFEMLKRDGHLPPNVTIAWSMSDADYVLVHHEHHFAEVDGQAWVLFGSVQPAHVLTYDGVPIVSVYENPARRSRRRPR